MRYPTSYDEFVIAEIKEFGHDFVEAQFASGYEPTEVHGVWVWREIKSDVSNTSVMRNTSTVPYTPVNLLVTF